MGMGGRLFGVQCGGKSFLEGDGEGVDCYDVKGREGENEFGGISWSDSGEGLYEGEFWCTGAWVISGFGWISDRLFFSLIYLLLCNAC
jgi:hypothetical protein